MIEDLSAISIEVAIVYSDQNWRIVSREVHAFRITIIKSISEREQTRMNNLF